MPEPRRAAGPASPLPGDEPAWLTDELLEREAPRVGRGRVLAAVLSVVLVVALLGWALPWLTGASWSAILSALGTLPLWAVPVAVVLGLLALALEARTVQVAVRGAGYGAALQGHAASTALATAVPGGGIAGTFLLGLVLRRRGSALITIVRGVLAASLVELVVGSMLLPVVGLAAYALAAATGTGTVPLPGGIGAAIATVLAGVLAAALLALALRRDVLAGLLAQAARLTELPDLRGEEEREAAAAQGPEAEDASRREAFLAEALSQRDLLVSWLRERAAGLLLPTLLARVVQLGTLALALLATGIEVSPLLVVVVFALGRLLALVPLTPGGTGIAETVGATVLVALGAPAAASAAAMLLLMVTTVLVPLLAGAVAAALVPGRRR